jgi:hypothetical protein
MANLIDAALDDAAFLDEIFDRAVESWARGRAPAAEDYAAFRPHLCE